MPSRDCIQTFNVDMDGVSCKTSDESSVMGKLTTVKFSRMIKCFAKLMELLMESHAMYD